MTRFRAVLLDWRGTLVHIPSHPWRMERALVSIGRPAEPDVVDASVSAVGAVAGLPEFVEAESQIDRSAEIHRATCMRMFKQAGLDPELAEALYQVDVDPASHSLYPDVPRTLAAIRNLGARIAIVSDIHFDVRPDLLADGVSDMIDSYVLSFEHGFQKPDARMFTLALAQLGAKPHEALMVGDTARTDGGAARVGIATLILPRPSEFGPRGLDVVPRLLG